MQISSVAHLHWKKGKRWEAFWSHLKIELTGDEFLSLGSRYNWFSTQWLTGATFNTLSSRRMEMYPKVQLSLNISSQPLHSGESWEAWGTGVPHLSTTYLNVLTEAPAPYFSSHRENWALGFLFSVASCQKHFFSDLDHKVREEHRARPPWNTYQYYNSSFRIHCCYVNKAAGEIGSLGNWEMRLALATWQMFPSLRTMALWHQPTFFYLSFLLLIYRKIEQQNNGP